MRTVLLAGHVDDDVPDSPGDVDVAVEVQHACAAPCGDDGDLSATKVSSGLSPVGGAGWGAGAEVHETDAGGTDS